MFHTYIGKGFENGQDFVFQPPLNSAEPCVIDAITEHVAVYSPGVPPSEVREEVEQHVNFYAWMSGGNANLLAYALGNITKHTVKPVRISQA